MHDSPTCRARFERMRPFMRCDDVRPLDEPARQFVAKISQRRHGKDEFGDDAVFVFVTRNEDWQDRCFHFRDGAGLLKDKGVYCQNALELNPIFGWPCTRAPSVAFGASWKGGRCPWRVASPCPHAPSARPARSGCAGRGACAPQSRRSGWACTRTPSARTVRKRCAVRGAGRVRGYVRPRVLAPPCPGGQVGHAPARHPPGRRVRDARRGGRGGYAVLQGVVAYCVVPNLAAGACSWYALAAEYSDMRCGLRADYARLRSLSLAPGSRGCGQ